MCSQPFAPPELRDFKEPGCYKHVAPLGRKQELVTQIAAFRYRQVEISRSAQTNSLRYIQRPKIKVQSSGLVKYSEQSA